MTTARPVDELDLQAIGQIIVNLGAAAMLAGHKKPLSTLREYARPASPELRFVRDVFSRSTDEVSERWYGGSAEACASAVYALAASLASGE